MEPPAAAFFDVSDIGLVEYYRTDWLKIFGYQLGAVTALSLVAAWLSMRRHLKR
jgi:hypothetical protein